MTVQESICPPAELAEADRLISDLAALLDAGLVAVQENLLGPARYGVASELNDPVDRPHVSQHRGTPRHSRRLR
jgi:hypothetical protein